MKQHAIPTPTYRPAPRRNKPIIPGFHQLPPGLRIRTRNFTRRRPPHIILLIRIAMRRVKQKVRVPMEDQIRRLHQRPIAIIAVQDLHCVADGGKPVRIYLLKKNRGGFQWRNAVVAVPAVADAVAVHFEHDVA